MKIKLNFENVILLFVIMIGISISIYQFIYNRSLWLDESYLALNIMNRSHFELLQTLDYCQVAPILFLQIEKIFSSLMGNSEFVLRLFPLISYLGSIYFIYKILKILNLNIYIIIVSLSIYMFNEPIIYYSSEVKQYMIDVLVLSIMYYLILKSYKNIINKYFLLGVLGVIGIFLSNVSPIILLCCGIYLFYNDYKGERKECKYIMILSATWILFFAIYYLFFIYNHPIKEFMLGFWSMEGAFMPTDPFDSEFYQFIKSKYYIFNHDLFSFGWIGFYIVQILFLFGCFNLLEKRKFNIFVLSVLPIVVHLVLSSMKLYPFDLRLILYICPAFIIILSYGLESIFNSIAKINVYLIRFLTIPAILCFLFITYSKLPLEKSELKSCFEYLQQNAKENDKIYFSYFSSFPLQYYEKISGIYFPNNNTYFGSLGDDENFIKEINAFDGKVWFVISDYTALERNFMLLMKDRMNNKNHILLQEYHVVGASALLYEIKSK